MIINSIKTQLKPSLRILNNTIRNVTSVAVPKKPVPAVHSVYIDKEWDTALPFKNIPGPSKLSLAFAFLPGGKYYNIDMVNMTTMFNAEYGEIMKFPDMFGRPGFVFVYDPNDFEKVCTQTRKFSWNYKLICNLQLT